jgi:hypothetical protein
MGLFQSSLQDELEELQELIAERDLKNRSTLRAWERDMKKAAGNPELCAAINCAMRDCRTSQAELVRLKHQVSMLSHAGEHASTIARVSDAIRGFNADPELLADYKKQSARLQGLHADIAKELGMAPPAGEPAPAEEPVEQGPGEPAEPADEDKLEEELLDRFKQLA